jgi:hypothetical protein
MDRVYLLVPPLDAASMAAASAARSAETSAALRASGSGRPGFCTAGFGRSSARREATGDAGPGFSTATEPVIGVLLLEVPLLEAVSVGDRTRVTVTTKAIVPARHKSTNVRNGDERGLSDSLTRLQTQKRDTEESA